jgi:chromosome partitioning protein
VTRRIAFINEKGGVGKTTLSVNVAAFFALKRKKRVLLVDLDTQGHAAKTLGIDVRGATGPTVFDLLTQPGVTPDAVTRPTPIENLWLIPAWKEMAEFPVHAAANPQRARLLALKLGDLESHYDVVIFDSPPSFGLVSTNVLLAAEEIVIPVATTYLGLDGCAEMVATVDRVAREFEHPKLRVTQIIPTMYRKTQMAEEVLSKLKHYFPGRVAEPLSLNVSIDEAQSHGKIIWEHAPWSRGAALLQKAAERIEKT